MTQDVPLLEQARIAIACALDPYVGGERMRRAVKEVFDALGLIEIGKQSAFYPHDMQPEYVDAVRRDAQEGLARKIAESSCVSVRSQRFLPDGPAHQYAPSAIMDARALVVTAFGDKAEVTP